MKNYFEHDVKVQIQEAIFLKQKDWQWFVEYVEKEFNLNDVKTWKEYENLNLNSRKVFSYFIRITQEPINEPIFSQDILSDIYLNAKYFNNKIKHSAIQDKLKTQYGKILFLFTYIIKLENRDNNFNFSTDTRIYKNRNFWELINFDSLYLNSEEIILLANKINLEGFEEYKKCIFDNLNKTFYEKDDSFLEKYKSCFLNANAFEPQFFDIKSPITWQENYLLDMIKVSFDGKKIIPLSEFDGNKNPDFALWTRDIISYLKRFFDEKIEAIFILETIEYIMYGVCPSDKVLKIHLNLLNEEMSKNENKIDFYCSSFVVVSEIFKDKLIKNISSNEEFRVFMKNIQSEKDPILIEKLKNFSIQISKEQKEILKNYRETQYKKIDEIKEESSFNVYLTNPYIPSIITLEYFSKVYDKFNHFITKEYSVSIVILFYNFMNFLIRIKSSNSEIDKKIIEYQMISLQKLWQDEYYIKIKQELKEFSYSKEVKSAEIEEYNNFILKDPKVFADICIPLSQDSICGQLEIVSKNILSSLFANFEFDEIFPYLSGKENIQINNEVNRILIEIIDKIKEEKGYRLLNRIDTRTFLGKLHKVWEQNILLNSLFFEKEYVLYEQIKSNAKIELIDLNTLTVAHVAQLFPLLEIKIREFSELVGIFPFNNDNFIKFKDPSSILISIIEDVYKNAQDCSSINDIIFVYNAMYNGSSLNIRNEFIHGRKYINKKDLNFAFKITLISICIIEKRIQTIKEILEAKGIDSEN